MMLLMGIPAGSDYGSSESGSFVFEEDQGYEYDDDANEEEYGEEVVEGEEDAFDVHAVAEQEVEEEEEEADGGHEVGDEIDMSAFDSDEAYARALQEAEEREVAIRLMALARITDCEWRIYCFKLSRALCYLFCRFCFYIQSFWGCKLIVAGCRA